MNHLVSFKVNVVLIFFGVGFAWNIVDVKAINPSMDTGTDPRPDTIIVREISISGNTITKRSIILRELNFKERDTLSLTCFSAMMITGRQNIFNTRLFNFVNIDTVHAADNHLLDVRISVVERWYIWPIPYFEISDRNFNVWWETRDFQRLSYGFDFMFSNARGRNETLTIITHFGFNQKYGFTYQMPYINHRQTLGIGCGSAIELNHEIPVYTLDNKPVYLRNNSTYLKKVINGFIEIYFRPDIFSKHTFRLAYSHYDFDSAVVSIPGFSMVTSNVQQFFSLNYLYKNDHRDVQYYPLRGYCLEVEVNHAIPYEKVHNSYLRTSLRYYRQVFDRWYCAIGLNGKLCFEKVQPYFLQRGLGYGRDFVRGYEYYVVDGQHFILLKNNLKFALIPQHVERLGFIQSNKFNTIPLSLYMNAFADMGYVYHYPDDSDNFSAGNTLENSFLIGCGLGLDFTTYYNIVVRLEGSVNRMLQPGIYLHFIAPI
jgi:outer membrane protein assembly factor BamA